MFKCVQYVKACIRAS